MIGYEDEGIYIRADHLLVAAKAELAIGQLPGSKYNCVMQDQLNAVALYLTIIFLRR